MGTTVGYEAGYDVSLPFVTHIVTTGIHCCYGINKKYGYKVMGVSMSVKDLLAKVNKTPTGNREVQMIQEIIKEAVPADFGGQESLVPEVFEDVDLSKLSSKELLELNRELTSWLKTHECQTGTDNKLDLNDRPYDHKLYLSKLKQLEQTASEYFTRPLGEELEGIV